MKNFRLLIVCLGLFFLDMPSPFGACAPDTKSKLSVNVSVIEETAISFEDYMLKQSQPGNYYIGDSAIDTAMTRILKTGKYYSEEDECYYDIEVTSYNIESIIITKTNGTEEEITIGYTVTDEDVFESKNGYRNISFIRVNITLEYEIIIPEAQPE